MTQYRNKTEFPVRFKFPNNTVGARACEVWVPLPTLNTRSWDYIG